MESSDKEFGSGGPGSEGTDLIRVRKEREGLSCDQTEFRMFLRFIMLLSLVPAVFVWYRRQLLTFPFIQLHSLLCSRESAVIREFIMFSCTEV